MLGLMLGIVLGLGLAFVVDALDTRVRSANEVGERLGLPQLARVPPPPKGFAKDDRLVMLAQPTGTNAEAFRMLRTNLDFADARERSGARTILVTSAVEQEGKSTTAANLAIAEARAGRRVALVDLDLRVPYLDRFFGLLHAEGITDVALGTRTARVGADSGSTSTRALAAVARNGREANGRAAEHGLARRARRRPAPSRPRRVRRQQAARRDPRATARDVRPRHRRHASRPAGRRRDDAVDARRRDPRRHEAQRDPPPDAGGAPARARDGSGAEARVRRHRLARPADAAATGTATGTAATATASRSRPTSRRRRRADAVGRRASRRRRWRASPPRPARASRRDRPRALAHAPESAVLEQDAATRHHFDVEDLVSERTRDLIHKRRFGRTHRRGWLIKRALATADIVGPAARVRRRGARLRAASRRRRLDRFGPGAELVGVRRSRCRSGSCSHAPTGSTTATRRAPTTRRSTTCSASSTWSRSAPGRSSSSPGRRASRIRRCRKLLALLGGWRSSSSALARSVARSVCRAHGLVRPEHGHRRRGPRRAAGGAQAAAASRVRRQPGRLRRRAPARARTTTSTSSPCSATVSELPRARPRSSTSSA